MTTVSSTSGTGYSFSFVSLVGDVSALLLRFFSLRRSVETLALLSISFSGEIFWGVGIRRGKVENSSLISVTGELTCRLPSVLVTEDVLLPILSTIGNGEGARAPSNEGMVAEDANSGRLIPNSLGRCAESRLIDFDDSEFAV